MRRIQSVDSSLLNRRRHWYDIRSNDRSFFLSSRLNDFTENFAKCENNCLDMFASVAAVQQPDLDFFSCFCLFLSLSFSLSVFLNQRLSLFPFHPWDVIRNFCVEISRNNSQAGSGFIDFLNVWSAQNISEGSEHQIQSLNNSKSQFRQNKPFYKTDEFGPLHVYSVVIYFAKQLMI